MDVLVEVKSPETDKKLLEMGGKLETVDASVGEKERESH